jgi:hypothetical protein
LRVAFIVKYLVNTSCGVQNVAEDKEKKNSARPEKRL